MNDIFRFLVYSKDHGQILSKQKRRILLQDVNKNIFSPILG